MPGRVRSKPESGHEEFFGVGSFLDVAIQQKRARIGETRKV